MFFFMIRDDPSRSELIRSGLAVQVDPVRIFYLPLRDALALLQLAIAARTS